MNDTQTNTAPAGVGLNVTDEEFKNELVRALARIAELEGMMDAGQLIGRPDAIVMHAAKIAHEVKRAYRAALGDDSQPPWDSAPEWKRKSTIDGVRVIMKRPDITPAQKHSVWCAGKTHDGWVHGETLDRVRKIHPLLIPYKDIPDECRTMNELFDRTVRAVLGV